MEQSKIQDIVNAHQVERTEDAAFLLLADVGSDFIRCDTLHLVKVASCTRTTYKWCFHTSKDGVRVGGENRYNRYAPATPTRLAKIAQGRALKTRQQEAYNLAFEVRRHTESADVSEQFLADLRDLLDKHVGGSHV